MTSNDLLAIIAAVATLVGSVSAAAVAIITAMRTGQDRQAASAAIAAEQQNRYLATRGAEPVTMQSPPMGTGDGRIDKAVTQQLANAPTSPSTVGVQTPRPNPTEQPPLAL